MGWGGRWEGGSGWGTHVHPWLIHVNVWQNLLFSAKVKDMGSEAGNERYGPLCIAVFLIPCSRQRQPVSCEETHAVLYRRTERN